MNNIELATTDKALALKAMAVETNW